MAFDFAGGRLMGAHRSVFFRVFAVALLATLAACSGSVKKPPTGTPEPDRFLFERGTEQLTEKHWLTSREYFRQLVDSYPQSPFRADAKLGVGDTYIGEKSPESFVLAANEFREFLTYYPTHARAGYAQFKLGMTYFYQMHGPERDQTETREAINEFERFVERYPASMLMSEVQSRLRDSRDRLSESDYLVGYFYYKQRWYPGAVDRFKVLLKADPGFTNRDAVYFYLGEALFKTNKRAEALPYYERLLEEFQQSEYLPEATKRIAELKAQSS